MRGVDTNKRSWELRIKEGCVVRVDTEKAGGLVAVVDRLAVGGPGGMGPLVMRR